MKRRNGTTAFLLLCSLPVAAVAQSPAFPYWPSFIPFATVAGKAVDPIAYPHPSIYFTGVHALIFTPDGAQLAVAAGPTISMIDVASGESQRAWPAHVGLALSLAVNPEGELVSTGHDGFIAFWDMAAGKQLRIPRGPNMLTVLSPDGTLYATRNLDKGEAQIVETATGRKVKALKVGQSRKGGFMAMTILSRELAIVNGGHSVDMAALAFNRDGSLLAAAGSDAKIWEVATGQEKVAMTGHSAAITAVAFSPDGKLVATGSLDNAAKLFDAASGRELRSLTGHMSAVQAVAFSPDGKLVATGSWDNTVKLWEVESGREVRTLGVQRVWEAKRAQLGECGAEPPSGSAKAETGQLYCTVSVTLRNASAAIAWLPNQHYKVFLYRPPASQFRLLDALSKDQREAVEGVAMGASTRYLAVGAGEEAELTLVFKVPENADTKGLFLVLLDAPPIAVGS